jgi:hypothetical protein
LQVRFGLDLDGPAWPSTLGEADSRAGVAQVGPAGLLGLLETRLGLGAPPVSAGLRAASLVPAVRSTDGFWSDSAQVDPVGVAVELLRWRDELANHGWDGQSVSPRLEQLSAVTRGALPGTADRLRACCAALTACPGGAGIDRITMLQEDLDESPPIWQDVFSALRARGTSIEIVDLVAAEPPPGSDLAACRATGFAPRNDGTLQLVRPGGPVSAADRIAAWLAAEDDLEGTVIVTPDALLDSALARHGVSVTGARAEPGDRGLLQLLPLVVELAWMPQDPLIAHELLCQPVSPVPVGVAWRLDRALHEWPAVDSDTWRTALADGLDEIDDGQRRASVERRLNLLLSPVAQGGSMAVTALTERAATLLAWATARQAGDADDQSWSTLIAQLMLFQRLVNAVAIDNLARAQIDRLVRAATDEVNAGARTPAQAGIASVASPSALLGPAQRVVWWNFTRAAASSVRALPLRRAEHDSLRGIGVVLPAPADAAEAIARRWRRPLELAQDELVLVTPHKDVVGRDAETHPLWDELTAGLTTAQEACLARSHPAGLDLDERKTRLAVPTPKKMWHLPTDTSPPRVDKPFSPSSAGALIGCPFHWVVRYPGQLRRGRTEPLGEGNLVKGLLAHHIIEEVLPSTLSGADPDRIASAAGVVFDTEGPRLAAALFVPGEELLRDRVRGQIVDSVRSLVTDLSAMSAVVQGREVQLEAMVDGIHMSGRADLLFSEPPAVVDVKWASARRHREQLERGTSYQLAVYATLAGAGDATMPSAYYIVERQLMLTTTTDTFRGAQPVDGPSGAVVWQAFRRALEERLAELAKGAVVSCARHPNELLPESEIDGGVLRLEPGCRFCEFLHLCGGVRA